MKNNTHSQFDNREKQHYKKKYLERRLQEEDAEKEIYEFKTNRQEWDSTHERDYRPPHLS